MITPASQQRASALALAAKEPSIPTFQAILFFAMGVLLLWVDWRGLERGSLPFGSSGFLQALHLHRERSATAFWLAFGTYALAGLAMIVYAMLLLAGAAPPMPFSR